jgi:hypothetical protein
MSADAESMLRRCRRPLVVGIGGGGDVVGALATAEHARIYDHAQPLLGGVSWERRPIDPLPGPRPADEIENAQPLAPAVLLAGPETHVRGRHVRFAESRMAEFLGQPTVLVDPHPGPRAIAAGLSVAAERLGCDLVAFIDVGGDALAQGHEAGLSSPLCDAVMLAAAARLAEAGVPVLAGVFGIGCDAELTPEEVLAQLARVAADGGYAGARGLTEPVAERLEAAIASIPTEASAQAVRAYRGATGPQQIRDGQRTVALSAAAALTFYLDVTVTYAGVGRLARAVADATSLAQANAALGALGIQTELDRELAGADPAAGNPGAGRAAAAAADAADAAADPARNPADGRG